MRPVPPPLAGAWNCRASGGSTRPGCTSWPAASSKRARGMTLSKDWGQRVEREAQKAEKWQARQEERERRGLTREPEQDRERQREERGLGLGR